NQAIRAQRAAGRGLAHSRSGLRRRRDAVRAQRLVQLGRRGWRRRWGRRRLTFGACQLDITPVIVRARRAALSSVRPRLERRHRREWSPGWPGTGPNTSVCPSAGERVFPSRAGTAGPRGPPATRSRYSIAKSLLLRIDPARDAVVAKIKVDPPQEAAAGDGA